MRGIDAKKGIVAAFAGVVVLGGGNFLAVRVSNGELAPFWGAGLRFSLAALVFVVIAASMRLSMPRGKTLALTALYGLFVVTLSYALMYWALTRVTAGTGAIVLAMVPLVTVLLAAMQRLEKLSTRTMLGALTAFGGIVWMTVGEQGLVIPLDGLVAILAAAFTIGQSVILGKHVSGNHPVITNAVGMSIGAPLLLALSAAVGEPWTVPSQTETLVAVSYLVLFGSVGLFVLSLLVVRHWTASAMSYAFVLFPLVTMLAESWILEVPVIARNLVGAAVVMAGVWLGALSRPRSRSETPGEALSPAQAR